MTVRGGDVTVDSGTGVSRDQLLPLVKVTVVQGEASLVLHMAPDKAAQIGRDLLSAATMAWADTGMRTYARAHGIDGDGLIGAVKALVDVARDHGDAP